jgi:hypothetical protein
LLGGSGIREPTVELARLKVELGVVSVELACLKVELGVVSVGLACLKVGLACGPWRGI